MRNAASVLGIIGGIMALFVGFASYGYTEAIDRFGEVEGLAGQVENVQLIRIVSFLAPLLAIAGGAMARIRALWAGLLLLTAAGGMYYAFDLNVFTIFPVGFIAAAGLMALAAGRPDEPRAHF